MEEKRINYSRQKILYATASRSLHDIILYSEVSGRQRCYAVQQKHIRILGVIVMEHGFQESDQVVTLQT
jgi:hypothetical protein